MIGVGRSNSWSVCPPPCLSVWPFTASLPSSLAHPSHNPLEMSVSHSRKSSYVAIFCTACRSLESSYTPELACNTQSSGRDMYRIVEAAQLVQGNVPAHVHVAKKGNTRILANLRELVDDVLHDRAPTNDPSQQAVHKSKTATGIPFSVCSTVYLNSST